MARLRGELETAVRSVPGLRNAVENAENAEAGQELDAEQAAVVDDYMGVYERLAALLARHGASPAERLRDIHFSGLARGPGGRLMTPEDAERAENARILKEADDAVWGSLWGRIDASSLKALGYSSSELRKSHGPGLFAPKGTGVSLDKLPQEMAETGLLPQDGGADALWERLKQGRGQRYFQDGIAKAERAATVRSIQEMPAQEVTPGAPLDKKAAENLARSFGKMENRNDGRITELPMNTSGKYSGTEDLMFPPFLAIFPAFMRGRCLDGLSRLEREKSRLTWLDIITM